MLAFSQLEQMLLTGGAAGRLLLAAALGCAIGIDREYHHRPSGVRTNVLICFGSAMFTFLSPIIAGPSGSNLGQIASNIVQGIGFLGAGLILGRPCVAPFVGTASTDRPTCSSGFRTWT